MDLPPPIEPRTAEDYILGVATRQMMEDAAVEYRRWVMSRCTPCFNGEHTSPPDGNLICQCGVLTCACIATPLRFKNPW